MNYFLLFTILLISSCNSRDNTAPPKTPTIEIITQYDNLIPVAIIGSGPAGLSAAQSSCKRGYHTVVFQGPIPRGSLNFNSVMKDWPGLIGATGKAIMQAIEEEAVRRGAKLSQKSITFVDVAQWPFTLTSSDGERYRALSVIIATGSSPRTLDAPGVTDYLDKGVFLEISKKNNIYEGKRVAIVGGSDDAIKKANKALMLGAKEVIVLVRGKELKGSKEDIDKLLKKPEVTAEYQTEVTAVIGDTHSLQQIEITSQGRKKLLPCNIMVVAIGIFPSSDLVKDQVKRDLEGHIELKPFTHETSTSGIFAAGTVADPIYKKGFTAASQGFMAGYDSTDFLKEHGITEEALEPIKTKFYTP